MSTISDQTTLNLATIGSQILLQEQVDARVTSIQGEGIASSILLLYDVR